MLHKIGWVLFIGVVLGAGIAKWLGVAYDPPTLFYNKNGQVSKQMKIWNDTIAVSSATPSISISSAGFSQILSVQPQVIQNSATLSGFAWANVQNFSTSSVTLTLASQNLNTVTILGISVLSGSPLAPPTGFSGTFVALTVIGY